MAIIYLFVMVGVTMKICMFTNTYLPHVGGVARSVDLFATDLRRSGNEVLVVAPEFDGQDPEEENTLRLPAIQEFNGSDFSVRIPLPYVVEKAIEAFRPDIIHSHHPFLLGDTAIRVARKNGLPLVFTHHTLYERYTHYVPMESEQLQQFVIHLATEYANLCSGVIAPSKSIARLIASRGVRVPITVIPTGVDTALFANGDGKGFRSRTDIPGDAFVVGTVGRLAPEKNLDFLARAAVEFIRRKPSARFLVVGNGPSAEAIAEHFDTSNVPDRLILAGQQEGEDLADAYASMDLFIFASHTETQGMVLAEAMAAGLPVIALDASGVRDIVENGENGKLLPASSTTTQMAETIGKAAEAPDEMNRWRENACKTARGLSRESSEKKMTSFYLERIDRNDHDGTGKSDPPLLDELKERIKTEWDLFSAKVKSVRSIAPESDGDSGKNEVNSV